MHYHCEIIIPSGTQDIEAAVKSVMAKFDESIPHDHEKYSNKNSFWDFYVIGGRFAGSKQIAKYDKEKLDAFNKWCTDEKITVSGLTFGKQEIYPSDQIPKVDNKWNELFPHSSGKIVPCPMFKHSNDQFGRNGGSMIEGDISALGDSHGITCCRVIFAGASYESKSEERTGSLEAIFMLSDSVWNGVNHMDVTWDGTIGDALRQWNERLNCFAEGYKNQMQPKDDWLCVTVDYHS